MPNFRRAAASGTVTPAAISGLLLIAFLGDGRKIAARVSSFASGLESGMGAFPNQIVLQLGKRAEDIEHRHSGRRDCADGFAD